MSNSQHHLADLNQLVYEFKVLSIICPIWLTYLTTLIFYTPSITEVSSAFKKVWPTIGQQTSVKLSNIMTIASAIIGMVENALSFSPMHKFLVKRACTVSTVSSAFKKVWVGCIRSFEDNEELMLLFWLRD